MLSPSSITPERFQKLHPVHYHILAILKVEVPVTLIRTCMSLYEELIPKIYQRIEITEGNYDALMEGVETFSAGYLEYEEAEERQYGSEEGSKSEEASGSSQEDLLKEISPSPTLWSRLNNKNHAFSHTKYLTFSDHTSAMHLVNDTDLRKRREDRSLEDCFRPSIFPNVTDIHLDKHLVAHMAVIETDWRQYAWPKYTHPLKDFSEALRCHSNPTRVSLEWPGHWEPEEWMINSLDDAYFDINEGLNIVLWKLTKQTSLNYIDLQVDLEDLQNVYIDPTRSFMAAEHAEFSYHIHPGTEIETTACLRMVWLHYAKNHYWKLYPKAPSRYCLPPLQYYQEGIERLCLEIKADDMERFECFKKKLDIRDKIEEDTQARKV